MKAKISIYKNDGVTDQGFPVKLILTHQRKVRRKTIGYATQDNWDERKNEPLPNHPDFEFILGAIFDCKKNNIRNSFSELENFEDAINIILGGSHRETITLTEYFDIEIERMRIAGRHGTADNYKSTQRRLNIFAPLIRMSEIDRDFLKKFRYSLSHHSNSHIRTQIGILKALYNKALMDPALNLEDKKPFINATTGLHVKIRRQKNRYLDDDNMRLLIDLEKNGSLTKAQLRTVRLSLLQFYFGGLNLKDLYYLKKSDFYDDRVLLSRSKLGQYKEEYDVKVFPIARDILNKMKTDDPEFFFNWGKDHKKYKIFFAIHQRRLIYLQKVYNITLSPTNQRLNTNTFRHTFATRAKFLNVDADIIRELMGHERNDIDTVYKDKFPQNVRDVEHQRIIFFEK